jgi:deoxyribodipyrimidine photo-lyase
MRSDLATSVAGAPSTRVRVLNEKPINPEGDYVLYWMIASRRPRSNFSLDRAMAWAVELGRPVVVVEGLKSDYPFASDRLHRFVIDGMADNHRAFAGSPVLYYPYVEPSPGHGRDLIATLSRDAALVITDDFPGFFLPQAVARAADQVVVRLEAIDSNGLLPLSSVPRAYPAAVHFRRHMQTVLREHLRDVPSVSPAFQTLPSRLPGLSDRVLSRWPAASAALLDGSPAALASLPVDHTVGTVAVKGGPAAASRALSAFVRQRLRSYHEHHSHPDDRGTSRLSPYLHFGQISSHEVFAAVASHERWSLGRLGAVATGARTGWWGVGPGAEAFLDQLVVWRELAFNTCAKRPDDYDRYEGLPGWAQETLNAHADDPRPYLYDCAAFERAETHDPLWNAAQLEMRRDGWMHNYMRMLWGKKILEWSATPREALATMQALMNRWCLDGRDPNSYAGYMWVLGRYDRPWPERPIYGAVRSMSSANTVRKVRVRQYLMGPSTLDFADE